MGLAGCETTSTPGGTAVSQSALPLSTLDQLYHARTAMVALAEGTAADPAAASQAVADALPVFRNFSERLGLLERSFNSADYRALWDQLEAMGTLYQFSTIGFSADQLRWIENHLTSFRNNVADIRRAFDQYLDAYEQFLGAVGPEVTPAAVRANVPLVNRLTTLSVGLDNELRRFSEQLMNLSRSLREALIQAR
jgi:hypothetical protein